MAGPITELLSALGAGGAALRFTRRWQRRFVQQTQTEWVRAGRTIHYGPVGALCGGTLPGRGRRGQFGALGLVDGALRFDGRSGGACDGALPFEAIRWIGLRGGGGLLGRGPRPLVVHVERAGRWHVAVWLLEDAYALAEALAERADRPLHDVGARHEDFGPARALRMVEDVYGDWHENREDALYLAPDRLLFGWQEAIMLDAIERVDVLARGSRWRGGAALLRIEHAVGAADANETADGEAGDEYEVTGFVVARAAAWAEAIAARRAGWLSVQIGRKKRDD